MRKYLIILSTIIVIFIFYLENKETKISINEDESQKSITQVLKKDDILLNKNQIIIKGGNYSSWFITEDCAYGLYIEKSFFTKILFENTKLKVQWVTNKKVMLPGFVHSMPNQDTVICAKTPTNKEIYIVIVKGKNIKKIADNDKAYYSGDVEMAKIGDLLNHFDLAKL